MAEKKKFKIISERINVPFKETSKSKDFDGDQKSKISDIKKEETEEEAEEVEEETLEEEIIPETIEESFADFSSEVINPTLEATPIPDTREELEEELAGVPSIPRAEAGEAERAEQYEVSVYNMPEYTYETEAFPTKKEMEERKIMIRPEDIREARPRTEIDGWHEIREDRQRGRTPEDAVVGLEERDRATRMPWEYKERRRRVK